MYLSHCMTAIQVLLGKGLSWNGALLPAPVWSVMFSDKEVPGVGAGSWAEVHYY